MEFPEVQAQSGRGHCIGVAPYYLTHKAEVPGYHPKVILAGRRINDSIGKFIAEKTVKLMIQSGCGLEHPKVIVVGITFKEDCADLRNSKVFDIIRELREYRGNVSVHDPIASPQEAVREYGITLAAWDNLPRNADAVIIAVPHKEYRSRPSRELTELLHPKGVLVDVKANPSEPPAHLTWRL